MSSLKLGNILGDIEADAEKRSWEKLERSYWVVNIIVNGYGLNRKIPIQNDDPYVRGMDETQMKAMVRKLKSKGFDTSVKRETLTIERIV